MNPLKFERVEGVCPKMDTPGGLRLLVSDFSETNIGQTLLCNQCWVLIFEQAISLSRSGRQTADNFVHRATRSKMAVFKTTPLIQGYGHGRFFGSEWSLRSFAQPLRRETRHGVRG